ncbi:MAG: hypothetical protein QOF60_2951 [Actinomycetota bacterium]|jgi:hypothetical protein|nr:hypothetical protein [Actinomycetota bacterium]
MADTSPLPVLLSRVLGELTAEVESAAGVGPGMPSLAVWSNVVRCVADGRADGIGERALPAAARISRRLATAAVTGSTRREWITAEAEAGSKARHLRLTDAGRAAADVRPARLGVLDAEWKDRPLRGLLEGLVSQFELELPQFPASYGTADPSAIGGPYTPGGKHGVDWKPVPRREGDTVSSLPLTALLSQALVAFTMDYERAFPWPLASTANVLVHLASEPRPLADVPGDHGIAGNGKSLLERHLIATVTADPANPKRKLVALTDRGAAVVHHHPARLEAVEAEWRNRYRDALVAGLRQALGAVPTNDHPDHVVSPLHRG